MNLAQIPTEEKSKEITTIPELLDLLNLRGCWMSIEEMGCQRAIAQKVIEKKEDDLLELKENQKELDKAT